MDSKDYQDYQYIIDEKLAEADRIAATTSERLSHDEVFSRIRIHLNKPPKTATECCKCKWASSTILLITPLGYYTVYSTDTGDVFISALLMLCDGNIN